MPVPPVPAARARSWLAAALGAAAALAGRIGRSGPGVLGPLLICYGLHLAWAPLGWIAAGGFLLAVDWRIS